MLTIGNLSLPSPTALSVHVSPRGGSTQYNTLGQLVSDGATEKRTVEIVWTRMAATALAQLYALLDGGGFFTLTYPDPVSGARQMSCRVRERATKLYQYTDGAAAWADVKLTLEER